MTPGLNLDDAARGAAKAPAQTDAAEAIRLSVVYLASRRYDPAVDCKPADDAVVGTRIQWLHNDPSATQPMPPILIPQPGFLTRLAQLVARIFRR